MSVTRDVESRMHVLTATSESYVAISNLKKQINDEIKEATAAIEQKYADQLRSLQENHDFYVTLLTP